MSQDTEIKPKSAVYAYQEYDHLNPNVWDVVYLDDAIAINPVVKAYMIKDLQSWTRNYLLIPIQIFSNLMLAIIIHPLAPILAISYFTVSLQNISTAT
jgi:hypothetical protein